MGSGGGGVGVRAVGCVARNSWVNSPALAAGGGAGGTGVGAPGVDALKSWVNSLPPGLADGAAGGALGETGGGGDGGPCADAFMKA